MGKLTFGKLFDIILLTRALPWEFKPNLRVTDCCFGAGTAPILHKFAL